MFYKGSGVQKYMCPARDTPQTCRVRHQNGSCMNIRHLVMITSPSNDLFCLHLSVRVLIVFLLNFTSFCCISWISFIAGHQIFTAKIATHVLENEHARSHRAHMHTFIQSFSYIFPIQWHYGDQMLYTSLDPGFIFL
jgi:hypothetical protein